jgi:hypothetical protein
MPLLSGRGLETWEVRVMGGLEREDRPRNGARWVCTLTLETRNRPRLTDADLTLLIDEDAGDLFAAIDAFDAFVNFRLPTLP